MTVVHGAPRRSSPARPHHGTQRTVRHPGVARYWLWAAIALAFGHFIASAGPPAWAAGTIVTVLGLGGLVARHRWAQGTLWVGLGLTLGVVLHTVLGIVHGAA